MSYPRPLDQFWADILDRYRYAEVDGQGGRCQLATGHDGQHILQHDGRRLAWAGRRPTSRPPAVGDDVPA